MLICMKAKYNLHWWGDMLLLIHNGESYYVLAEEEVFLVEQLARDSDCNRTATNISQELGVEPEIISNVIDTFVENYAQCFYFSECGDSHQINISGKKGAFFPLELHISLTNSCVQRCKHCYKSAESVGMNIEEKDLYNFLDRLQGAVPLMSISGGDPVLHPMFHDLINRYGDSSNICVHTSGYLCNDMLLQSFKKCTGGIVVSLYSSDSSKHDSFTGRRGSFRKTIDTILSLKRENIPVGVATLLTNSNFEDIRLLINQLHEYDVENISVGKISPVGRAKDNSLMTQSSNVGNFDDAVKELLGYNDEPVSHGQMNADNTFLPYTPFKCSAGSLCWSIFENGEIHPCGVSAVPELLMGNLSSFDDTILYDRKSYISQICDLPIVKSLTTSIDQCPLSGCTN